MADIVPADSWTHPEGWRDRPFEAPATIPRERERCQFLSDVAWPRASPQDPRRRFIWRRSSSSAESARRSTRWRHATCARGASVRLEVNYEHEPISDVGSVRRRIQGGPQNIWRYHDFLPLEGPQPQTRTGLPAGCTPLIRADRLAERLGLGEVWVKNDAAQPDALLQGPRRLGRRHARPRARLRHARLRLDRQPRELRRRPRRRARDGLLRPDPGRPRGAEAARDRDLRHEPRQGPRQLRRRQPPLHRALGRPRELGVREHQHAPVLRRGLEDRRLRDRRAARLGDPRSLRRADRLGLAVHEDRQGLLGVDRRRPARRRRSRR